MFGLERIGSKAGRALAGVTVAGLFALGGTATAEPIELRPNLELGDTFTQRLEMAQKIDQTVMGQPMLMTMDVAFDLETTVADVPQPGVFTLTMKYAGIEAEATGPMGAGKWKSGDPPPANPMLTGFSALDGMEITYDMDSKGKSSNIRGTEAIIEASLENVPEGMRPMMRDMMEQQFGEEQMAAMMNMGGVMYPDGPVEIGDTWSNTLELGGMMPMAVTTDMTLTDADDATATVEMTGSMKTTDDAMMNVGPGMEADMSMQGEQSGTVVFGRDKGWVRGMEMSQNIEGQLEMANPGNPQGPPMLIPMKVTIDMELETVE